MFNIWHYVCGAQKLKAQTRKLSYFAIFAMLTDTSIYILKEIIFLYNLHIYQ